MKLDKIGSLVHESVSLGAVTVTDAGTTTNTTYKVMPDTIPTILSNLAALERHLAPS